ncbi:hypothetical protein AAFC00_000430 [Neodothiora populina]|uniref:Vacuolar protein sorting-associated protein 51 homolog n=1 Tax=Neodothiora populina TaxID=2781224 RepID=A0ABR3PE35_9PEZI
MSTIASPRPSINLSRRTSTSSAATTTARSPSVTRTPYPPPPAPSTTRRNRAALREFYGLKEQERDKAAAAFAAENGVVADDKLPESEIDNPGFDADKFVKDIMDKEGLEGIMRTEAELVSEIRGLDGERKALVYDNYSKLIAATDTIRKMRTNMDPLAPTTSTLTPAISHIAETATSLSESIKKLAPQIQSDAFLAEERRVKQQETVRYLLKTPDRLRRLRQEGHIESSRKDWEDVKILLEKLKHVKGTDVLRKQCEEVMGAEAGT